MAFVPVYHLALKRTSIDRDGIDFMVRRGGVVMAAHLGRLVKQVVYDEE
jgi:hypothetical protein